MKKDLLSLTFDALQELDIKATLSNVIVSKSRMLGTPWTFSNVTHSDGYSCFGTGNNCYEIPFDISFIRGFLDRDAYQAVNSIRQKGESVFNNSLLISIACALSRRKLDDATFLQSQDYEMRVVPQAGIGAITDIIRKTDVVAIVGYFYSYVAQLAAVAREIHVTELTPSTDFEICDFKPLERNVRVFPASSNKEVLGKADVVIMTGMTLSNNTASTLIEYAKNARLVMMQGPTCSFYPKALFDAGVDLVGTILFPTDNGFHERLVNSGCYWYYEKQSKHVLIARNNQILKS